MPSPPSGFGGRLAGFTLTWSVCSATACVPQTTNAGSNCAALYLGGSSRAHKCTRTHTLPHEIYFTAWVKFGRTTHMREREGQREKKGWKEGWKEEGKEGRRAGGRERETRRREGGTAWGRPSEASV